MEIDSLGDVVPPLAQVRYTRLSLGRPICAGQGGAKECLISSPRTSFGFPSNLILTMAEHFGGVSRGSAVPRVVVLRESSDNVTQFMEQGCHLRLVRLSPKRCYSQPLKPSGPHWYSPRTHLHNRRNIIEKWSIGVEFDSRVWTAILGRTCSPRLFVELFTSAVRHTENVCRLTASDFIVQ